MAVSSLISLLIFIVPATASADMCVSIFAKSEVSLSDYSEISIDIRESAVQKKGPNTSKKGTVLMTGSYGQLARDVIGKVDYVIQNNSLRLTGAVNKPEYYGQNVFAEMISAVVAKNPNIQTVTTVISGEFYARYVKDFAASNNHLNALATNPVLVQLANAGFGNIQSALEVPHPTLSPTILIVVRKNP